MKVRAIVQLPGQDDTLYLCNFYALTACSTVHAKAARSLTTEERITWTTLPGRGLGMHAGCHRAEAMDCRKNALLMWQKGTLCF
jgi:hypothetical protein